MEENHANFSSTVHVDLAFKSDSPELTVQLFHLLMFKIDPDWPWVVHATRTRADTVVYRQVLCSSCLGRVWRAQPLRYYEIKDLVFNLCKQLDLNVKYVLTSTHKECLDLLMTNPLCEEYARSGLLDMHTMDDMEGGAYIYQEVQ